MLYTYQYKCCKVNEINIHLFDYLFVIVGSLSHLLGYFRDLNCSSWPEVDALRMSTPGKSKNYLQEWVQPCTTKATHAPLVGSGAS